MPALASKFMQQFTYQSWTGLVYIDLNPTKGDGGYIIGEGLNGGFTACTLPGQGNKSGNQMCEWNEGLVGFLKGVGIINSITANIVSPTSGQQFTKGDIIHSQIQYSAQLFGLIPLSWTESEDINTTTWSVGNHVITSKYGTTTGVVIIIIHQSPDDSSDDPIKTSDGFNLKFVIKNSGFNDYNSMSETEIQSFLNNKAEDNPNHLANKFFSGKLASYWIKKGAETAKVNPRIILTKLQTEQGLINGPRSIDPTDFQLGWALNAGYTEDRVYAKYRGFTTQMLSATQDFFRHWYDLAKDSRYILGVDTNEDTSVDNWDQAFKTLNAATFSIYKYTPHVYEGGRLVYSVYSSFFGGNDLGGPTQ